MPRIIMAECKQEISTFNPVASHFSDFRVLLGEEMLDYHRQVGEEIGGALAVFDKHSDVTLVPTAGMSANTSGGLLTQDSFRQLCDTFFTALKQEGEIDGAYFALHGAMQAEGENDPEGYLLEQARSILGDEIPFVVSLDLHGILTDRMLCHSDAIVIYHTYPHVDFFETGSRSAELLIKLLKQDIRAITARVKIPVLARGDEMITETGAIHECIEFAQKIESSKAGLAAGVMWGNPFTDVPELRSNAVVVMDRDEAAAQQHAIDLGQKFWAHHEKMQVPLTSLESAALQTIQAKTGTVVLMDAADATSSGASGDSNAIVAELLRHNYPGRILAPVVDARAVEKAFQAGIGAQITVTVGGALDPHRYQPLEIKPTVRSLSDGDFRSESFGWRWNAGNTAVLQADNLTLVVGSRPVSLFDRSWFYANGQDPRHFDAVVVKSPHCEPHMFADWCHKLINVDAPGATSANLQSLGHTICTRPVFPLDDGVEFSPQAEIFQRR